MHEEFKLHYDKLRRETNDISKRFSDAISEKKSLEAQYETQIQQLKNALDLKQKMNEELQGKSIIPVENEIMRSKIMREVEIPFKAKYDELFQEKEKINDEMNFMKKDNVILKEEIEGKEKEYDKIIHEIKQNHNEQIMQLTEEIKTLHKNFNLNKEKKINDTIKKDLEEYKTKWMNSQAECQGLRESRDQLKRELNEFKALQIKQIEEIDSKRRQIDHENNNLKNQIRIEKEEINELQGKISDKIEDSKLLKEENQSLITENSQLIFKIESFQSEKRVLDLRLSERENSLTLKEKKIMNLEISLSEMEKKVRNSFQFQQESTDKLKNDFEKKLYREIESKDQKIIDLEKELKDVKEIENEERNKMKNYKNEFESLKQNFEMIYNEKNELENEIKRLQDEKRETLSKTQENFSNQAKAEIALKQMEEALIKSELEKKNALNEQAKVQGNMSTLISKFEEEKHRLEDALRKGDERTRKYKNKVREANLKIKNIVMKLNRNEGPKENIGINLNSMAEIKEPDLYDLVRQELRQYPNLEEIAKNSEMMKIEAEKMAHDLYKK